MPGEPISVRRLDVNDVELLQQVSIQTFTEAFAEMNDPGNMAMYLEQSFSIPQLKSELQNQNSTFFLASQGDVVAGYLKLNTGTAQTEPLDAAAFEIERIYVTRQFLGEGIGQSLLEIAFSTAGQQEAPFIWLGGWEANYRAIRFYEKNGFNTFGRHDFMLGNDKQTDILMRYDL